MRTLNVHSVSPPPEDFVENSTQGTVSQVQNSHPAYPPQNLGQFNNNRPVSIHSRWYFVLCFYDI